MAVSSKPSQEFVPLKEVRDGVAILKDGSMRMILMTSSLNFALKSEDEQAAILLQFQNFLNSIEFTTQIFIRSRRLDIRPYLTMLQGRLNQELNDLLRIQIQEYVEFIRTFTESVNIMTKTFFVIVPYAPSKIFASASKSTPSPLSLISQFSKKSVPQPPTPKPDLQTAIHKQKSSVDVEAFEEARSQLEQRANVVKQGLSRTGVRVVMLDTDEIIELYYKIFNPGDIEKPVTAVKP